MPFLTSLARAARGSTRITFRTFIRTLTLVGVVGAVFAPSALAQTTPSTLTGETLTGTVNEASDRGCGGSGAFSASGAAAGPYPGTFTETGSVTFGEDSQLTANFTVTSGSTTVTGTKTVTSSGDSRGFCGGQPEQFGLRIVGGSGAYKATITTPAGTSTDEGTVTTDFVASNCTDLANSGQTFQCNGEGTQPPSGSVTQTFTSTRAQCADEHDNDTDGTVDFPDDQGCSSAEDDSEAPDAPQCSDRLDNDGDGETNFPDDQGCENAEDDSESPDAPQCSDRLDNDSDGKKNLNDPGCSSASDNSESPDPVTPPPPARECTIKGSSGNDIIRGTSGDDVICAGDGNDIVYGGGGNDTIYGGRGNDILRAEGGNDRLYGGPGADVLRGGAGRDYLSGAGGNDQLIGGAGNDRLVGGAGSDVLSGQDGADSLNTRDGVEGNDSASGGAGSDSCATDRWDARSSC